MSIGISAALGAEVERLRHDIERHIAMASDLATENERLRAACKSAMSNLGVPQPGYSAPVAEAYRILEAALAAKGDE